MNNYPSIFNDSIGPVMRGPSSSHCAASLRIGRICRDLMDAQIEEAYIEYDPNGSLATTHKGQGSDMGLFSGFMGWSADDERLPNYQQGLEENGIKVKIEIRDIGANHPNTYQITLKSQRETRALTALSVGGGMIEVIAIDGATVSMKGDFCETLIYTKSPAIIANLIESTCEVDEIAIHRGTYDFVEIKSNHFLSKDILEEISGLEGVLFIKQIEPVLPIKSRKALSVPFITVEEMLAYNEGKNLKLWELAIEYESVRGNISKEEVIERMNIIVDIMYNSIHLGLAGTHYKDRILGSQSVNFKKKLEEKSLVEGDVLNTSVMYTSAMMEVKSSMGVIVAAPTAGSCGALPGTIIGTSTVLGYSKDEMVKAMLAAGLVGVFIAAHATFAAEVGGCMAECGSASGMAAAGVVVLKDGSLEQSLAAASMALQSSLGLICDMVADRVEAPCLNRNVMATSTAISCANMAIADYDQVIPLDEVIETMKKVGDVIPNTLRCTGLGGLAITKAAKRIEAMLEENEQGQKKTFYKVC